ncbi:hypothetical protein BCR32DRAFT_324024 [Anaeromyces robustus]|uniref:Uncharacterized protein n=1 Tax=Anaeromyces robustus TaxID=1754192 RepID=A0A1Y1XR04_9FUNG|nr:hypothetical protein BCR32DRAFT_324024 [Anaeromyces robustus]|eukprot:ORX88199.1 hypothetical protein BCR32DRAFT_324024 [Anaeromyces robustus]
MNIKGILGIAILALLGISNASPYNSGTKTVSNNFMEPLYSGKTKAIPKSGDGTKMVPADYQIRKCQKKSGIPVVLANEQMFTSTCLIEYKEGDKKSKVNPKNSACFYNKNTILCIDRELTNIDYCDKSKKVFNYDICLKTIHSLSVIANGTKKFVIDAPLVTYPKKEKLGVKAWKKKPIL